jgi:hypothetical protein
MFVSGLVFNCEAKPEMTSCMSNLCGNDKENA